MIALEDLGVDAEQAVLASPQLGTYDAAIKAAACAKHIDAALDALPTRGISAPGEGCARPV